VVTRVLTCATLMEPELRRVEEPMASIAGGHHIALTVTDLDRSVEWYSDLLGMHVAFEGADETVRFKVLAHPDSGWVLGLRQYANQPAESFNEFRTGLDHFAFAVRSAEELRIWESELQARQVTFTPTTETPIGSVIVFRDPDNIQLEFWVPQGS
jgi:glyoxylase I family protein